VTSEEGDVSEQPAGSAKPAIDASMVDAAFMAQAVAQTKDEHLREGLQGEMRTMVLEEIFRRFPEYVHQGKIKDLNAAIRWKVTGRADGEADRYTVVFENGACRAGKDLEADPRVTFQIEAVDLLKLVTGNANAMILFGQGRLRVAGDLLFAARVAGFFRIPSVKDAPAGAPPPAGDAA
jgi:putative sterol carrier protein